MVDAYAGADPDHRLNVRVVTAHPYHALFAKTLFIEPDAEELAGFEPDALVLHTPDLEADPDEDGTRSGTFVVLHPSRAEVLIGGTFYAGEIKKSIFTLMNDRLPLQGVFPMHCSANVGPDGDVAIFFGLSGTGKTTLSAEPSRLADRRRRARLERHRRLQLRGRLLREGDPPLARRRSPRSTRRRTRTGRSSRTSSSTSRASSTSTTTRRRRTRAPPTSSSRSATRSRRSVAGIRARSCSSPRTRSASCRRSRA